MTGGSPRGGAINIIGKSNPLYPPMNPVQGVVGHTIGRCIRQYKARKVSPLNDYQETASISIGQHTRSTNLFFHLPPSHSMLHQPPTLPEKGSLEVHVGLSTPHLSVESLKNPEMAEPIRL